MRKLVVKVAAVALVSVGGSSTASADSIAVTSAFLGSSPGSSEAGLPALPGVRTPGRGYALGTTLMSSFAAGLAGGCADADCGGSARGQRGVRGRNASSRGGFAFGPQYGEMFGGGGIAFAGQKEVGPTLKPSVAVPGPFTLTRPPARNGSSSGSRSKPTPTVVLGGGDVPVTGSGAAAAVGGSDFAGAPGAATPEPATLLLLGAGLGGAVLRSRRRRAAQE